MSTTPIAMVLSLLVALMPLVPVLLFPLAYRSRRVVALALLFMR